MPVETVLEVVSKTALIIANTTAHQSRHGSTGLTLVHVVASAGSNGNAVEATDVRAPNVSLVLGSARMDADPFACKGQAHDAAADLGKGHWNTRSPNPMQLDVAALWTRLASRRDS